MLGKNDEQRSYKMMARKNSTAEQSIVKRREVEIASRPRKIDF